MKTAKTISPTPAPRRIRRARGFTLLEVLVSIALVLLIILGVNQVFSLTSQAVGAGNALSEQVRNQRNAQSIITNDLKNAEVRRAPFLLFDSEVLLGFRNIEDQVNDLDYSPTLARAAAETALLTVDRDRDGREDPTNERIPRALLTTRTHRADILKFFTRLTGRRQTGNHPDSFTSGIASSEQYIVYCHLRQPALPDNLATGRFPGIGPSGTVLQPTGSNASSTDNPNNFYATQWVLGRTAFLLREPELVGGQRIIRDTTVTPAQNVTYYGRGSSQYGSNSDSAAPFTENSQATQTGTMIGTELVQYSLYDLIGVPMERYRTDFLPKYIANGRTATWTNGLVYRQTGFPTPSRPLTSQGVARTVPCFVPACTQFIVEYAGDFVTQDDTGLVTAVADGTGNGTDGIIDFNVVTTNGVSRRVTRWYGFPRDINADGKILAATDVVPLRDFLSGPMPFERVVLAKSSDYGDVNGVAANAHYRCAWGTDTTAWPAPKMIRIVMATDDPAARLANEQYTEFVVELP